MNVTVGLLQLLHMYNIMYVWLFYLMVYIYVYYASIMYVYVQLN